MSFSNLAEIGAAGSDIGAVFPNRRPRPAPCKNRRRGRASPFSSTGMDRDLLYFRISLVWLAIEAVVLVYVLAAPGG